MHIPVLRFGEPYESLDVTSVAHFATGEPLCEVSQANAGLIARDIRKAPQARALLRQRSIPELCSCLKRAADLFMHADLNIGSTPQSPQAFVQAQSATTGLPEHMCRFNMEKLAYVLSNLSEILDALTRGLDPDILARGYGEEHGIMRSMQATSPVIGMVLPSNSPGVHGLWLPVIALQIGMVLKPGPLEPWTPYRMTEAFFQAGIPREAIAIYPGEAETGAAVVEHVQRTMIFGGKPTVERYRGNPRVQVHGPGFSKILLGNDAADQWEDYLDLMVDSVLLNGGRSCINCSGIWTPRHSNAIAEALAARLGHVLPLPHDNPNAQLAAFTIPEQADAIDAGIEQGLREKGVRDATAQHRKGEPRLVREERFAYLRPTVIHCESPEPTLARTEYMFPYVSVVECATDRMLDAIGDTLVGTVITDDEAMRGAATDAQCIDRLNLGAIPTVQLNWKQPHEGNIIDFLFRERALQMMSSGR
ncbi:MAG: aldehyde dehydrogenase family protein [Phycisphaerales bacterium]